MWPVGKKRDPRWNRQKLSDAKIRAIVRDYEARWDSLRLTQVELAKQYGVSQPTIHRIVSGKAWRDVTEK